LFVESGYERATIRAIAAAADVDAGLVMHYFGSKQALFQQVIQAHPAPDLTGTIREVSEEILGRLAESLANEPVQSLAILRSMLTNREAAQTVAAGVARYRAQITQAIGTPDADLRAALVSALIMGVTVSRHLLTSGDLNEADPDDIIALLRPCFHSLMAVGPTGEESGRPTAATPGS
jgi:AcrR family transcriptional regulator